MRLDQAIVVGCGGTGSHLLEPLARLLTYHPDARLDERDPGLILVDGDKFEDHNAARQLGTEPGAYKVQAALARVKGLLPNAIEVCRYINRVSFADLILGGIAKRAEQSLLVILSVDNHATRRDVFMALQESGHPNLLCLSPGNGLDLGQVHVWARVDGKDVTPCPLALDPDGNQMHPELHDPEDRIPGGCVEEAPSTPQLIVANAMASMGCLLAVQAWLDNEPLPDEVCFNCRQFKLVPAGALVKLPEPPKRLDEATNILEAVKQAAATVRWTTQTWAAAAAAPVWIDTNLDARIRRWTAGNDHEVIEEVLPAFDPGPGAAAPQLDAHPEDAR